MTQRRLWLTRALLLPAIVSWLFTVFSFSAQTGEASSRLSGGVCERIAALAVPQFRALPEEQQQAIAASLQTPVRKTAHFCEYALGGGLFMGLLLTFPLKRRLAAAGAVLCGAICAALDEWHQSFVSGRGPGALDVLLDTAGALAGALAVGLLCRAFLRRHKRGKNADLQKSPDCGILNRSEDRSR